MCLETMETIAFSSDSVLVAQAHFIFLAHPLILYMILPGLLQGLNFLDTATIQS